MKVTWRPQFAMQTDRDGWTTAGAPTRGRTGPLTLALPSAPVHGSTPTCEPDLNSTSS
jgi:hypothetical protein